ncbi:MAG: hypothetical protein JSU74_01310 [Candidatus Zixiibacteriota bacterium]|nr:MAG: hypothetical protein JSU74_01310 [candidate division Zixibacteria bacterium]
MKKTFIIWPLILLLLTSLGGLSHAFRAQESSQQDASKPPCSDCHVCASPTKADPCLEICVWTKAKAGKAHTPDEGPDVAMLDQLEELYGPVTFDHKHHAEMVGMGEGCAICHHYSPPGKFPPCEECHGDEPSEPQTLRKPGLKGAYHRQCMGCHREWSHDTKCIECHLPSNGVDLASSPLDSTDILGIEHPVITPPVMRVWTTPYRPGPIVTLHHQEHIDLFGLRCVDCHKQENCSYCHDLDKEARVNKTDEEIHAICNDCHLSDACDKCHDTGEKPAFTHAGNGNWELNRFHQGLSCRACHPTGRKIGKLSARCSDCHGGWNQENFRHAVTGLQLDEIHVELDCSDCHIDLRYGRIPRCNSCHDDCRNHEDAPPGEYIRMLSSR